MQVFTKYFCIILDNSYFLYYLCTQNQRFMARIIVREILKEKGVSIKELAARMGITSSAVSQLLANPHPSIQQLDRIANAIGVDVMNLFGQDFSYINGYVETDDVIYPIKSREQFVNLIDKVDGIVHIPTTTRGTDLKECIDAFYYNSINNAESGALMRKYGINEVFTLSFDAESQRFSLTICKGNGITQFKTFDFAEYNKKGTPKTPEKNCLVDDIIDFIETVYE